jgi:serine/threonine protein kinase
VVMEYLEGGELYDYWHRFKNRRMPEDEVKAVFR